MKLQRCSLPWIPHRNHPRPDEVVRTRSVAEKLHVLARKLQLNEIVINTWTFDAAARRHSYALLADAFGL